MAYEFPIYKSIPYNLEFLELKDEPGKLKKPFNTNIWPGLNNILQPSSIQIFVTRIFNLMMKNKRIILAMSTGTGKTLTSLLTSVNFKQLFLSNNLVSRVIVVSFTSEIFKKELLSFPELGFISHDELKELNRLRYKKNVTGDPEHVKAYKNKYNEYKRRIIDINSGGYFMFFGYKELINALLVDSYESISTLKPKELYAKLMSGEIEINKNLLDLFKGSLLICDEIHVTYNSLEKNNYGIVLQFILDTFADDIYAIFMSATIVNNNPREIVDIANMMSVKKFDVNEYFEYENIESIKSDSEEYIIQETEDKIISDLSDILNVFKGRIIVYEENNKNYPDFEYMGDEILPGLRITKCEMSPLHQQTYNFTDLYNKPNGLEFIINTIVFPNPDFDDIDYKLFHPDTYYKLDANTKKSISHVYGLYNSEDIKKKIGNAPDEWKKKVGIEIKKEGPNYFVTGPFLKEENIRIYSEKLYQLLQLIKQIRAHDSTSKIFIFHPYVQIYGILLVRELLYYNGYLNEYGMPNDGTYMIGIDKLYGELSNEDQNKYNTSRYIASYNFAPETKESVLEKYNDPNNNHSQLFQFILASKIIYQSATLKDTRYIIKLQFLDNYSSERQIDGRPRRNGSHNNLPPEDRYVKYYTLCSSTNIKLLGKDLDSNEIVIRKRKFNTYNIIRDLNKKINEYGLNNFITLPDLKYKQYDDMGNLSYTDKLYKVDKNKKINDVTYRAYDYYNDDIKNMLFLLRRLFYTNPVWHIDQIKEFIKNIPFNIPYNFSNILDKINILDICLFYISYNNNEITINKRNNIYYNPYIKVFNQEYRSGKMSTTDLRIIVNIGDYFILTPIINGKIKLDKNCFFNRKNISNKIEFEIKPSSSDNKHILEYEKFLLEYNKISNKKSEEFTEFLYNTLIDKSLEYHDNILKLHIEGKIKLPKELEELYKSLKILQKNKYVSLYDEHTYDKQHNFWDIKPKQINDKLEENKIIIGYIRDNKFKIRYPYSSKSKDLRKVNKGINCESLKKDNLKEYINITKFKTKEKKTYRICSKFYTYLLELEIDSRTNNNNIVFLYLYNDIIPQLK